MAADLRLRGQELWRRNREGELSVPGFWPRDLAPSFWPLLLVLLLLLPLAGLRFWQNHRSSDPRPDSVELQRSSPLALPVPEPIPAPHPMEEHPTRRRLWIRTSVGAFGAGQPPSNSVSIRSSSCFRTRPSLKDCSVLPSPFQSRTGCCWSCLLTFGGDASTNAKPRLPLAAVALELDYASLQLVNEQGDCWGGQQGRRRRSCLTSGCAGP